jgi:hypothetical protein
MGKESNECWPFKYKPNKKGNDMNTETRLKSLEEHVTELQKDIFTLQREGRGCYKSPFGCNHRVGIADCTLFRMKCPNIIREITYDPEPGDEYYIIKCERLKAILNAIADLIKEV